ncbi:hypothetical protein P3T22_003596 [Paraburkholderia sp. GAS348]
MVNRTCCGVQSTSMAPNSTSCCKSGATKPRQTFLQARVALEPGTAQDHHRSVAQLSGGKSGDPGTCEREARVCQSGRATEQPCREQPPTDTRTRATHAWLSRPETHTEISLVFRADPATFRAQAASATRFTLSQTTRSPVRCMARIHRTRPKSVDCLVTNQSSHLPSCRLTLGKLTMPSPRKRISSLTTIGKTKDSVTRGS